MSFLRGKVLITSILLLVAAVELAEAGVTRTTRHLNMRHGPGMDYRRITIIPPGSTVNVHSCNGNWCVVTWGRRTGFVNGRYLLTHVTHVVSPLDKYQQ